MKQYNKDIQLAFKVLAPLTLGCILVSIVLGFRLIFELKYLFLGIGYFSLGVIFSIGFYSILKVYLNTFKEELNQ